MTISYFIRRVFFLFMVIWMAASINFLLPRLAGRDPIKEQMLMQIASQGRREEDADQMIRAYTRLFGLDKPLWQQYLTYVSNVLRLDFGYSINNYPRTVMEIIINRGRLTLPFLSISIFLSFTIGILLGAFLGWNRTPNWVSNGAKGTYSPLGMGFSLCCSGSGTKQLMFKPSSLLLTKRVDL